MSSTDGLVIAGALGGWFVLHEYGQWYWRTGRGAARKLRKKMKRI